MHLKRIVLVGVCCLALTGTANGQISMRDTVSRLASIGSSYSPAFSPDGKTIAFVSDLSGRPQVWTVPSNGGWPVKVTALDDTVSGVTWSYDGRWLAVIAAPGGGMNQQVYLVSPDGTSVDRITAGGKETNRLGPWGSESKRLALGSNVRSAASMDSYFYALDTREVSLVATTDGIGTIADVSHDGRSVLLDRLAGRGSNDLYWLDLESGRETLLTPHEGPGSFVGAFDEAGESVYLATNGGRDRRAFGRITLGPEGSASSIEILTARDDADLQSADRSSRADPHHYPALGKSTVSTCPTPS